jgi:hypothetical protein
MLCFVGSFSSIIPRKASVRTLACASENPAVLSFSKYPGGSKVVGHTVSFVSDITTPAALGNLPRTPAAAHRHLPRHIGGMTLLSRRPQNVMTLDVWRKPGAPPPYQFAFYRKQIGMGLPAGRR